MNKRIPEYSPLIYTHKAKENKNKQTGYPLCNVNFEDTYINFYIILMFSSLFYYTYIYIHTHENEDDSTYKRYVL